MSHDPGTSIVIADGYCLIELALGCVDWPALARNRRLRHLDWSRASLVYITPGLTFGPARRAEPGRSSRPNSTAS